MKETEEKQLTLYFTHIKYSNMIFQHLVNMFCLNSGSALDFQRLLLWAQKQTGSTKVRQTEILLTTVGQTVLRRSQIHVGDTIGDSNRKKICNPLVFYHNPTSCQNLWLCNPKLSHCFVVLSCSNEDLSPTLF